MFLYLLFSLGVLFSHIYLYSIYMLMIFFHHSSKCLYTCVLFNLYLYIICVLFRKINVMCVGRIKYLLNMKKTNKKKYYFSSRNCHQRMRGKRVKWNRTKLYVFMKHLVFFIIIFIYNLYYFLFYYYTWLYLFLAKNSFIFFFFFLYTSNFYYDLLRWINCLFFIFIFYFPVS